MNPRIAVGTDRGGEGRHREYHFVYEDYVAALARHGATVVVVPWQDESALRAVVGVVDGVLITGGDDLCFDPPLAEETPVHPDRQRADTVLIDEATRRGLPVLGVCYGMQLMNHLAGGRLRRHLPNAADHVDGSEHGLRWLSDILGQSVGTAWREASHHHQGIETLGEGLKSCVEADDGLIEGFFAPEQRFWMGFQWHLEKRQSAADEVILETFVRACAQEGCQPG